MGEKDIKDLLKRYFKNRFYENEIEANNNYFKQVGFNKLFFDEYTLKELTDLEKKILEEHIEKKKSLKKIAVELNYSYSYTRRVYLESTDKLKIIARLHIFSENNKKEDIN